MKSIKLLMSVFLVFALGCSDQPDQRGNDQYISPNPSSPSQPVVDEGVQEGVSSKEPKVYIIDNVYGREPTEIREPRVTENNAYEDKIEANGKKPIFFNGLDPKKTSVAGITFSTSYEEAAEKLSPPYIGACTSAGDYYEENLCMLWSNDEPRRLMQVIVQSGYLGTINLPAPFNGAVMKGEYASLFPEDQTDPGYELIKKVYNQYFEKEESYDCLKEKTCQALFYNNDYINWILPNITLVFSKERKALIQVSLNQDVEPGLLASPLDLIKGEILIGDGMYVLLGDTWDTVRKKLDNPKEPLTLLETTSYRKEYVGLIARLRREGVYGTGGFDVNRLELKGSEILSQVQIYSNYNMPFMVNGQYLLYKEEQLSTSVERPAENFLTVRMGQIAGSIDVQKKLMTDLANLISAEINKLSNDVVITQTFSGFNAKNAPNRRLVVRTSYYDYTTEKGYFIYTSISVDSGNMLYAVELLDSPATPAVMETYKVPVDVSTNTLSGYALGDTVEVFDIDRLKDEAFIKIGDVVERVSIDLLNGSTSVAMPENKVELQKIVQILGATGAVMGLKVPENLDQYTTEFTSEIVMLSSASNDKGITSLCGTSKVFEIGITQKEFQEGLRDMILQNLARDKDFSCPVFTAQDEAGDGEARIYHFPNQNLKVFFSERVLTGVSIYKKVEGAN